MAETKSVRGAVVGRGKGFAEPAHSVILLLMAKTANKCRNRRGNADASVAHERVRLPSWVYNVRLCMKVCLAKRGRQNRPKRKQSYVF